MTFIYYEVFPVTLVSKQAVFIRHHQEKQLPPWIIPNSPNIHPNDIVLHHLVNFLGDAFDPRRTIVHSTSWRYEVERDRLLLTYLAVLPQGTWLKQRLTSELIHIEPIGAIEKRYGDHLFPPAQIERHYVLGHALDHLASLATYDPSIQAVLEPEWREVLKTRLPKSAGCLQISYSGAENRERLQIGSHLSKDSR
jgi:hypothetical protein